MNENLNLVEILKDCPKGIKLYSPVYGDVELMEVKVEDVVFSSLEDYSYPIKIKTNNNSLDNFTKDGLLFADYSGECMLFPSKEQRDWSKFKPKKIKFNPNTLNPFDKVLARDIEKDDWRCTFFSHIRGTEYKYAAMNCSYKYCIPYNDDTKHLVGTTEEAPEFYRYWED